MYEPNNYNDQDTVPRRRSGSIIKIKTRHFMPFFYIDLGYNKMSFLVKQSIKNWYLVGPNFKNKALHSLKISVKY